MKKSAIVFLLTYCIANFSFASFPDLKLAGPSKFFSHKPFSYWSNDKIYSSFTAEPFEENRLQVIFQDKDYTPANNMDFLKENFFLYHYYNPYKDNNRKVGEEIYFFYKER